MNHMSIFDRFARRTAALAGHPATFVLAATSVLGWALAGPGFGFGDGWQLSINTGTTIATFLMIFLLQNTQNRDSAAIQLKVDELIRAVSGARNRLLDLEDLDQRELDALRKKFEQLARVARNGDREPDGAA